MHSELCTVYSLQCTLYTVNTVYSHVLGDCQPDSSVHSTVQQEFGYLWELDSLIFVLKPVSVSVCVCLLSVIVIVIIMKKATLTE